MAQTLTEIKALLAAHGLRPKKRLGQCFLHDANHLRRIVQAADPQPGEHILEVGPGTGTLTEQLLAAGARVVAVELDRDLEPILQQRLAPFGDRATLLTRDVMANKRTLAPEVLAALGSGPFKLVANLPYQVASTLLVTLAMDHPAMSLAVVMVQKEVADRLSAASGGKDYGPMGVLVQAMCEVEVVSTLPPGCFWPAPDVHSAVVRLERRAAPLTDDPAGFAALVHRVFAQRRKQIGGLLGRAHPLPDGVERTMRAEQLTVRQFAALAAVSQPDRRVPPDSQHEM